MKVPKGPKASYPNNARPKSAEIDLRFLFQALPTKFLILDPQLIIIEATDQYIKATRTARSQIVGRHLFEVFPDNPGDPKIDGVKSLRASLERVLSDGVTDTMAIQKYDIPIPESEGGGFEERYWSPVNSPVLSPEKEILYIVHRVEDVTEFVRINRMDRKDEEISQKLKFPNSRVEADVYSRWREIQDANRTLHRTLVAHRKVEAEMADLITVQNKRENELALLNKELETFSYSVSHDLRAPLRSMVGFSQMLLEEFGDKLGDEGRDHLARIQAAGEKMGLLIEGLLVLSRVTRKELTKDEIDLSAMAENILNDLKNNSPERQVEIFVDEGLRIQGDSGLIQAAMVNLLGNAWKFTSKKKVAKIEFGRSKEAFFVRDNGAGFDMRFTEKLFGPFQRLHSAHDFEGSGIGLATVQRIINRHGGKIWVEARPEMGATFYFTL